MKGYKFKCCLVSGAGLRVEQLKRIPVDLSDECKRCVEYVINKAKDGESNDAQ
jgi:hypothetical protein